jgi:hypothetical protein
LQKSYLVTASSGWGTLLLIGGSIDVRRHGCVPIGGEVAAPFQASALR